jgi:SAM-dependent methyltransferase
MVPPASAKEFDLAGVVPWGRRLDEYQAFFALDGCARLGRVLDVGAGPSSFAAEACALGAEVIAVDPIYGLDADTIRGCFDATSGDIRAGLARARHRFVWTRYGSPEDLVAIRRGALERFLDDYARHQGSRYLRAALPSLPFADGAFALALSSHLLFLYSDDLDADLHLASMRELLRVAAEVRAFPLLDLDGNPSRHLAFVCEALEREGHRCETVPVQFEFQAGATRMLCVRRAPSSGAG